MDHKEARNLCEFAVVNGAFVATAMGLGYFGIRLFGHERLASFWPFFGFLAGALVLGLVGAYLAKRIFFPQSSKGEM